MARNNKIMVQLIGLALFVAYVTAECSGGKDSVMADAADEGSCPSMEDEMCLGHPGKLVNTKNGAICGILQDENNSDAVKGHPIYAFQGIPYAKPPVGKLRLKNPIPSEAWEGIRDGNMTVPWCPQFDTASMVTGGELSVAGQDDCLYLNIFTPTKKFSGKKLPVMVYLHGGGMVTGSADVYRPYQLLTRDVIYIPIHYRLGLLSFLSTEDEIAPGNQLMRDVAMALRWIKDNIHSFGGDADRVTLFGQSGGSTVVHLSMLNPEAAGLFNRAIMMSGGAIQTGALIDNYRNITGRFAQMNGCADDDLSSDYDSNTIVECLQNLDASAFVFGSFAFSVWNYAPNVIGYRIDGDLIPDHPVKLLKEGRYNKVDLISGINQDEGGLFTKSWMLTPTTYKDLASDFPSYGHLALFLDTEEDNKAAERVFKYYLGSIREYDENDAENVADMLGDYHMRLWNDVAVQLHSRETLYGKQVYAYEFKYKGEFSFMSSMFPEIGKNWVMHGDELNYLFDEKVYEADFKPLQQPEDLKMREILLDLWTNFAATGNPTPDHSLGFIWNPVSVSSQPHLAITSKPYMEADTRCQIRQFWYTLPLIQMKILFPHQVGAGENWRPWRLYDKDQNC